MNLHLWLIPILPLLGAAINGLVGRRLPHRAVTAIALIRFASVEMSMPI